MKEEQRILHFSKRKRLKHKHVYGSNYESENLHRIDDLPDSVIGWKRDFSMFCQYGIDQVLQPNDECNNGYQGLDLSIWLQKYVTGNQFFNLKMDFLP
ncbi:unnamed protein product, partial [Prunus brigantina]